ncbi:MAG TPA: DUF1848 domain-containing protein [Desulfitobacterium sp.]|nr:DUF1848 domain-containing protein [Desulfitobacterium sp.]HVJ48437.1 DUF1848 domain-containing protein [Desulfitobacterium sp.]
MIFLILSVSRRTDIPAFYSEWFFNRLKEGYVLVRNPLNAHQVSKVNLSPQVIDCIVFWTKDPTPMLDRLALLSEYTYYFQITINGYDHKIERNLPAKDVIIDAFIRLSKQIGKKKVIWRYDPIIFTEEIDLAYHQKKFAMLAAKLAGYTQRCVISFVDSYQKSEKNMRHIGMRKIDESKMVEIGSQLAAIAQQYNISLETCSEVIDLASAGIKHSKCIDDQLISEILGAKIKVEKDKNQRQACGCVASVDIAAYNTCHHGCLYCYANYSDTAVKNNVSRHNPQSPLLIGELGSEDKVTDRKMISYIQRQLNLFDD